MKFYCGFLLLILGVLGLVYSFDHRNLGVILVSVVIALAGMLLLRRAQSKAAQLKPFTKYD